MSNPPKDPGKRERGPTLMPEVRLPGRATARPRAPSHGARDAAPNAAPTRPSLGREERELRIARAAYILAERRGFIPGHELDDWLAAEQMVDGAGVRGD